MGRKTNPRVLSVEREMFEKSKVMSVSLKMEEAYRIRDFGVNDSLTNGIRECLSATELVVALGEGSLSKGKLRLEKMITKIISQRSEQQK
jgi:hypothetical protein